MTYKLKTNEKYGFLQISPTPTQDEIINFYNNEFYSGDYKHFNDSALEVQLKDRDYYESLWEDVYFYVDQLNNVDVRDTKWLDIGCGFALALTHWMKRGVKGWGFDPAPEAVEYAKKQGVNAVLAGMDNMNPFPNERFDVVTLMNVLEHLSDPIDVISQIHKKTLKKGGILVIDVPNEFSWMQQAAVETHSLNQWWVAPPGHLNYFNRKSLTSLLEDNGFEVITTYASFPLEMFLLFGDNYVDDSELGSICHQKRVAFEKNIRRANKIDELRHMYRRFSEADIGRQITVIARAT